MGIDMKLRDYLKENKLIIDGAMGTYFASLEALDKVAAEAANLSAPCKIEEIHRAYIRAGASMLRTNTFAANCVTMQISKKEQKELIAAACHIAREAVRKEAKEQRPIFIAGSIGPIPEQGERLEGEILEEYKRMCDVFIEEKVDAILFETFSDFRYIKELVGYIKEKSDLFLITNFCLNKNGYTASGLSGSRILESLSQIEEIDAGGFNCGVGSGHMHQILSKLTFPQEKYMVVMPNAGYPEQLQNRMVFIDNAAYFVENMQRIADYGIDMLGGCCGTTPMYIQLLREKIELSPVEHTQGEIRKSHIEREKTVPNHKNSFYEKFSTGKKVVAVELDPPYDANYQGIIEHAHALKKVGVDIITLADSPMGRSRVDSILMSTKIAREVDIAVMPHVCCRDKNMISMRSTLLGAYVNDIRNILIVTGDPVPSASRMSTTGVFDYNSIRLMNFVKEMNEEHFLEEPLYYGGALNYGRGLLDKVVERMEKKIEAGAAYFLTQPIYSDKDIARIKELKERVDTKILCGIMPLVSYRNANFIKNEITGIEVPDEIVDRYHPEMTKEEAEIVGAEIASEIIAKLNPFADGYYFMLPFNRVSLMEKIKI